MSSATQTPPSTKSSDTSTGTYGISTVFAIATAFCIFVMFLYKDSLPNFWIIFWTGVPIILYIVSSLLGLATQIINCGTINPGNAFLAGLATPLACLVFMGIASISWFRVPIASAFAPLLVKQTFATLKNMGRINNSGSHLVDIRHASLEALEAQSPAVMGISYAYYLFFGILFGQVFTSNMSITC